MSTWAIRGAAGMRRGARQRGCPPERVKRTLPLLLARSAIGKSSHEVVRPGIGAGALSSRRRSPRCGRRRSAFSQRALSCPTPTSSSRCRWSRSWPMAMFSPGDIAPALGFAIRRGSSGRGGDRMPDRAVRRRRAIARGDLAAAGRGARRAGDPARSTVGLGASRRSRGEDAGRARPEPPTVAHLDLERPARACRRARATAHPRAAVPRRRRCARARRPGADRLSDRRTSEDPRRYFASCARACRGGPLRTRACVRTFLRAGVPGDEMRSSDRLRRRTVERRAGTSNRGRPRSWRAC